MALRDQERITRACVKFGWHHNAYTMMVYAPLFTLSYYQHGLWVIHGHGALTGWWAVAPMHRGLVEADPGIAAVARKVNRLLYVQRLED